MGLLPHFILFYLFFSPSYLVSSKKFSLYSIPAVLFNSQVDFVGVQYVFKVI